MIASRQVLVVMGAVALIALARLLFVASVFYVAVLAVGCFMFIVLHELFGRPLLWLIGFVTATGACWAMYQIVMVSAMALHRMGI